LGRAKRLSPDAGTIVLESHMVNAARVAGNRLRQENERLLGILLKLAKKAGGFGKLKENGLDDEEIGFLKDKFQAKE